MISSIIQPLFKIKIQPNMSGQEKKGQRIYDLLNAETKPKFLCLLYTKQTKTFYSKRIFLILLLNPIHLKGIGEWSNFKFILCVCVCVGVCINTERHF